LRRSTIPNIVLCANPSEQFDNQVKGIKDLLRWNLGKINYLLGLS
jgi:hypothetical protein